MKEFISHSRLTSYETLLSLKTDDQQLKAYYWNKCLCAALYPAIQTLEITLRNALNEGVKKHHTGEYADDDWWFEHIATAVQDKKINKMSATKKQHWLKPDGSRRKKSYQEQQVKKTINDLRAQGRTPIKHDDVISRSMFGYWVSFISEDYQDVTEKRLLWPNLLPDIFPNYPYKHKLDKIAKRLKNIKELRNRMSHHEPIWKFYTIETNNTLDYHQPIYGLNSSLSILLRQYDELLETIRWMSKARYDAFLKARLDVEFRKLCSKNGFYAFVSPDRVSPSMSLARAKEEIKEILQDSKKGIITRITEDGLTVALVGINQIDC